ncbi:hypothetical protein [Aeromonas veronii]|uniref:hypothetical protein n=1 Tax=Aeromonas veronii TaxID=654 RepID=UPI003D25633B
MDCNEIYVSNVKDANINSQRGVYIGLVISLIVNLLMENSYISLSIPYTQTLEMLSYKEKVYCLGGIYFFSGLYTVYNYNCAYNSFVNINDDEIKIAVSYYPSLMTINWFVKAMLAGCIGVWYVVFFDSKIAQSLYMSSFMGTLISFPYMYVLQRSSRDRCSIISLRNKKLW